jgi:hypothetical protein
MTIKISIKKAMLVAAAGGLAMQSSFVSAGTGSKFSIEQDPRPEGQLPPLQLDEVCQPLDVCSMPTDDYINDFDQNEFDGVGGKFSSTTVRRADAGSKAPPVAEDSTDRQSLDKPQSFSPVGVIFSGDVADFDNDANNRRPQMKFLVSGVRNDIPVDLFIVYNNRKATPEEEVLVSGIGGGKVGLPLNFEPGAPDQKDKLQIIAGVTLQPQVSLDVMSALPDAPLGTGRGDNLRTAVIAIPLGQISQAVADGRLPDEIFFQAVVIPHAPDGNFDFTQGQFSDVDRFIVDIPFDGGAGDTGGKAASFVADEGEAPDNTGSKLGGSTTPTDNSGSKSNSTTPATDPQPTDTGSKR